MSTLDNGTIIDLKARLDTAKLEGHTDITIKVSELETLMADDIGGLHQPGGN